jgi:hypothetical protein
MTMLSGELLLLHFLPTVHVSAWSDLGLVYYTVVYYV